MSRDRRRHHARHRARTRAAAARDQAMAQVVNVILTAPQHQVALQTRWWPELFEPLQQLVGAQLLLERDLQTRLDRRDTT